MRRLTTPLATLGLCAALLVTGGSGTSGTSGTAAPQRLPANGRFDYQIGGAYTPDASAAIVDRDRSAGPAGGTYDICYVNAFQTQPAEEAFWTGSHPDLLLRDEDGGLVEDPDWPGEFFLDVSTAGKRADVAEIVGGWIDGCRDDGFEAVEPDNLDTWTRSGGRLTEADAVAYATLLADRAHADGLAIAQKNAGSLGSIGRDSVGFDFAIAEECQNYSECDDYTDVYGDDVLEVEYTDNPRTAYTTACAARGRRISVLLRDRDVVPRGDEAYHDETC